MKRLLKTLPEWCRALLIFFMLVLLNGIGGGVTGR